MVVYRTPNYSAFDDHITPDHGIGEIGGHRHPYYDITAIGDHIICLQRSDNIFVNGKNSAKI